MSRLDTHLPPQLSPGLQPSAKPSGEPQVGTMLGQATVQVEGAVSLADSAEEISLHMAEKTEQKHHAERHVRKDAPLALLSAESILAYMAQSHDGEAQEKLNEFTRQILSRQASPRQGAAQRFKDVSQQSLALQYALRKGQEEGAPQDVLDSLIDALDDLELESGPQIRAGLNTIGAASSFADDAEGVAGFQQTYRDVVLGKSTLTNTLTLALERFGGKQAAEGLRGLIEALGQDIAATMPSTNREYLHQLVSDMYLLGVAMAALEGCQDLCDRLAQAHSTRPNDEKLMQDLIGISGEKWITESRFVSLAANHGMSSPTGRIEFLTGVSRVLKDLPTQVYADDNARQSVLTAAQVALENAIEEEHQ